MTRGRTIGLAIIILVIVGSAAAAAVTILGDSSLDCSQLATAATVEETLVRHQETRQTIEAINLGYIFLDVVQPEECPGKAMIVIFHGSEREAQEIRGVLGDSFHGVAYELRNV